ncbi:MAG: oligosaccharide flippase family protein [Deinococcota bacterium]
MTRALVARVTGLASHPFLALVGANVFKILAVLIVTKVAAVLLSAHEFGLFGQFLAVSAIVNMVSSAGLNNAAVRDISAVPEGPQREAVALEYFWVTFIFSVLTALLLLALYPLFGASVLGTSDLTLPISLLALSVPAFAFFNFALSYYSGAGQQRRSASLQATGALLGLLVFGAVALLGRDLVWLSAGYLLFLVTPGAVLFASRPLPLPPVELSWHTTRRKLGDSAAMFSAILLLPSVLVVARSSLAGVAGWDTVAMWQVLTRLSDAYMQVFAIYFAHFFLQRVNAVGDERPLLVRSALTNLAAMAGFGVLFYVFYDLAVRLLFTPDYLWGREFVPWQVGVDSLRVLTVVLMYYFIARRDFRAYISVEVAQAALLLLLVTQTPLGQSLTGVYGALLGSTGLGLLVALGWYLKKERKL